MSRQIQIRRGTAAEHENFTGAVGEITMDTTNNTIRVHDGQTPGGTPLAKQSDIPQQQTLPDNYDFVTDFQAPTAANNYTWYRKYKSGWVEQGGYGDLGSVLNSPVITVNFPVVMMNNYYLVSMSNTRGSDGTFKMAQGISTKSTTGMTFGFYAGNDGCRYYNWMVSGMSAQ